MFKVQRHKAARSKKWQTHVLQRAVVSQYACVPLDAFCGRLATPMWDSIAGSAGHSMSSRPHELHKLTGGRALKAMVLTSRPPPQARGATKIPVLARRTKKEGVGRVALCTNSPRRSPDSSSIRGVPPSARGGAW